jgi:PilZ domain-containing protein
VAHPGRAYFLKQKIAFDCTVVIGAPHLIAALTERSASASGEVLAFSDAEALLALDEIVKRRKCAIELERKFAGTRRGTALIARITADPTLAQSELRVVSHDGQDVRILQRAAADPPPALDVAVVTPLGGDPVPIDAHAHPPLDLRGTRRAPRFKIAGDMSVQVDGSPAKLIDLSTVGAQVVSPTILKPNQRVRVALHDDRGALRLNATIAWTFFEIPPKGGPHYRAGVNFVDANSDKVGAFCNRHRA